MKIITLWQPYASLIAYGLKGYETRSWGTKYRGPIAIHAAARKMTKADIDTWETAFDIAVAYGPIEEFPFASELPLGKIVAVADLTNCLSMAEGFSSDIHIDIREVSDLEQYCGNWELGRIAWQLDNVRRVKPLPFKGQQGLRDLPEDVAERLEWVFDISINPFTVSEPQPKKPPQRTLYEECHYCRYWHGSPDLPCAVNPMGLGKICREFERG
ncbi:MAG TPA: ASCH domain-containing protein [Stenomitos sp.]